MKPRRTTGNRRKAGSSSRHHLLELNVRTASIRRQRRQKAGGLLWKVSAIVILLSLLAVGARLAAEKFFFRNPEYSLKNLDATLNGVMSREELVGLTGFREGKSIFSLNLDLAQNRLAALPEVRSATIERIMPDTVKVTLERRVPVLLFASGNTAPETGESFLPDKSFLCDRNGVMLRPSRLDPEFLELPVVTGIDLAAAVPGKPLDNPRLSFAISLQEALSAIPEETFRIRSIDVSKPYAAIVTDASGARFTFGHNDLPAQLGRLRKLLEHCQETGRRLETANMMVARNTPVTFVLSPESRTAKITPVTPSKKTSR